MICSRMKDWLSALGSMTCESSQEDPWQNIVSTIKLSGSPSWIKRTMFKPLGTKMFVSRFTPSLRVIREIDADGPLTDKLWIFSPRAHARYSPSRFC